MASNASENKDTVVPHFFKQAVQNEARTKKEGRPIFDDMEMVTTIIPGDRLTKPSFVVEDRHKQRWPHEYEAFKRGEQVAQSGTPLEHWPPLTTARVAELKAIGIFSVETLSEVSDGNLTVLGSGGRALREQAKAYLKAAKDGALVSEQTTKIDELEAKIERLEKLIADNAIKPREKKKEAA
ncbi:MAG: hypothetical protein ACREMY_28010 [bacterium]